MSGLGRQPFAQYAALSSQGSGAGEVMGGLRAFPSGHGPQGFMQNQALPNPMMAQFIRDPMGPWNPVCVNTATTQLTGIPSGQMLAAYGSFRCPAPPSEADTVSQSVAGILSDSGYGSMARQSVGNPSVCDGEVDQSIETQSLVSRFQDLAKEDISPAEEPHRRLPRGQRSASSLQSVNSRVCPDCKIVVKTNSELK